MAEIDEHTIEMPSAYSLGPDPEPLGTRYELMLERAHHCSRRSAQPRPPRAPTGVGRERLRRRAHVTVR